MNNTWNDSDAGSTPIDNLVYLSNLIGSDRSLVQPGGGNTSVKLEETDILDENVPTLAVKGSGTDLRTITSAGFTHLYLDRLATLRDRKAMSDEDMMALMRACMLFPDRDPVPSVETPLHSLIPYRFVAHTHDVASLALTDTPSASDHVERALGREVAFLEYVRPGFPLARLMAEKFPDGPPPGTSALVMEKHGLAAWGDTAKECYESLMSAVERAKSYAEERRNFRNDMFGPRPVKSGRDPTSDANVEADRRAQAAQIAPVIRGELGSSGWDCVLSYDQQLTSLSFVTGTLFPEISSRGVMTPEHIMRAGRRPLILTSTEPEAIRAQIRAARAEYVEYASRNGQANPLQDWLKVIAVPFLGTFYASKDLRSALIARDCYRATMQTMFYAEAVERFESLPDSDACEMEYWPLERRKIEEGAKSRKDLDGKVAVIIGAASGIGHATALRFAAEGAHLLLADLDAAGANALAAEINARTPERAYSHALDVGDSSAVANVMEEAMLGFGGVDILFYTPGVAPELHAVVDMPDAEVERQMRVHYQGAVAATREAARVMLAQGTGGRLVYNASKAAFAPGEGAAAYGASKAALVHYVRNLANELGRHGITANYINADAVDTPLFRAIVRQRAESRGETEDQTLARYAERNVMREALVPAEAVAEAALWLASDRSAYTTGCVITVGGGAEGFPR